MPANKLLNRRGLLASGLAIIGGGTALSPRIARVGYSKGVFWHKGDHPKDPPETAGWTKYARNPLLGDWFCTCFDPTVLRRGKRFEMWYSWRERRAIVYTSSTDGTSWAKPQIVLAPSKAEENVSRPSVIYRNNAYEMWYTANHGNTKAAIFHASSVDGISWNKTSKRPALYPSLAWEQDSVMCPFILWDSSVGQYRMWYSAAAEKQWGEPKAIGYATSQDGLCWTKSSAPVFFPTGFGFDKQRTAACSVVPFQGWYYMFYIGFSTPQRAAIGVARSPDGITNWQRHPKNPILSAGNTYLAWDRDAIYKPSVIINGNSWLLWYNGRKGNIERIGFASHEGLDLGFSEATLR